MTTLRNEIRSEVLKLLYGFTGRVFWLKIGDDYAFADSVIAFAEDLAARRVARQTRRAVDESFLDLRQRSDEIEGAQIDVGEGRRIWVHTTEQIHDWLDAAIKERRDNYGKDEL